MNDKSTQIGRSCFKFLKRLKVVGSCHDFYNLYVADTADTLSYESLEPYFCTGMAASDVPPARFVFWCKKKLRADTDLAQHFTSGDGWLTQPVRDFILSHSDEGVVDPYAGDCALRTTLGKIGVNDFIGFDIDRTMVNDVVKNNDSLLHIPKTGRLLVTNPPYMSKCTATRYGSMFYRYFEGTPLADIYLIALEKCLASHENVVAIIPETFLLNRHFKNRLAVVVIIEENIFVDTTCPILVACFEQNPKEVRIYKNDQYLMTLDELRNRDKRPDKKTRITFNQDAGNIGLRGIDGTQAERITFCRSDALNYDRKMKVSSRLISRISVPSAEGRENEVIDACNIILEQYRQDTHDLLMAPFKGNNKTGQRRRRIDYRTARAIIEEALSSLECDVLDEFLI